jgi:hypothetical protein
MANASIEPMLAAVLIVVGAVGSRFSGRKTWACFLRPVLRPDEAVEHRLPTDASLSCASLPVMSARSVRSATVSECWVLPDVGEGEEESPWKRS